MHFPLSFCKNASPYFFHGAFAPSFIRSRRPCLWSSLSVVVVVEVGAVDGVGSGRLPVRRRRAGAGAARLVPLQFGRGLGDVDAERAVRHRVARPVDVDHVRARLGRVVVAVDRAVLVRLPVHLHLKRTCTHAQTTHDDQRRWSIYLTVNLPGLTAVTSLSDVNKDLGPKAKDLVPEATYPHQA